MKFEKKEMLALAASSVLLLFAATIFFVHENKAQSAANKKLDSSKESQVDIAKIQSLLTSIEKAPSDASIKNIDNLLKKLPDSEKKQDLIKRLDTIKINLAKEAAEKNAIAEAENAVKTLEDNQNQDNLTAAQEAINKIVKEENKKALQERLAAVKANLEAIAEAAQASANTVIQDNTSQTQQNNSNNYTYSTPSVVVPNTNSSVPSQTPVPSQEPTPNPTPTSEPQPSETPSTSTPETAPSSNTESNENVSANN